MDNFQLYRTNLILGGQMKWDLVIDSANAELYVSDFHLTPISNNIPYTYETEENLINNFHQDNVKAYYKKIEGYFYNEGLDPEFNHNWPLIAKKEDVSVVYSNIYDMGCRRRKFYNTYNKQFEFFCPLWLEMIDGDLKFTITIKGENSDVPLAKNALILKKSSIDDEYHNKFVKYFNSYINEAGLIVGTDDVFNIKFKDNMATLTGLDASDGIFTTKDVSALINDFTSRERPMMETDNFIMQSFINNHIICKQLFNFNLCFNIEDIVSGSITNLLAGTEVIISIDASIVKDGAETVLEKRDFYTEYDCIYKSVQSNINLKKLYLYNISKDVTNVNTFDYLHDYEAIDLMDKNKFCQKICHWSLTDNNDYIFNLYNGFSGLYLDVNKEYDVDPKSEEYDASKHYTYYECIHQYCNTPNTELKVANKQSNSTGWINCISIDYWNDFYKYITTPQKYKVNGTLIDKNNINGLKYVDIPETIKDIYVIGMNVSSKYMSLIVEAMSENVHLIYRDNVLFDSIRAIYNEEERLLILITDNEDYFSFGMLYEMLNKLNAENYKSIDECIVPVIKGLYGLMYNKIDPEVIVFSSDLNYSSAVGPSEDISEITYYKNNKSSDYVIRYDGKLKPTFVDETIHNTLYYKDFVENIRTSKYFKYLYSNFEPLYPSIDYCAILPIKEYTYDELPKVSVTDYNDMGIHLLPEYSWFNAGISMILMPELNFSYVSKRLDDGTYKDFKDVLYECIKNCYDINDKETITYILSLYDMENDWEYFSETNVDDYIYNIRLTLK